MARSIAPGNLPSDKGFAARSADDTRRKDDAEAVTATELTDVLAASNAEKAAYYYARAQQMANDMGCSVLCHWHVIPHFEHSPPTLDASLVPAIEREAAPPPPVLDPLPEGEMRSTHKPKKNKGW